MLREFFENSRLVRTLAMMIALGSLSAQTVKAQSSAGGSSSRGAVILVFDIVDSVTKVAKPAGGGGGGGDILVFDIVDSVSDTRRPAGGGDELFDILGVSPNSGLVELRVMVLGQLDLPEIYEVLVVTRDGIELGLMWELPTGEMGVLMGIKFQCLVAEHPPYHFCGLN